MHQHVFTGEQFFKSYIFKMSRACEFVVDFSNDQISSCLDHNSTIAILKNGYDDS